MITSTTFNMNSLWGVWEFWSLGVLGVLGVWTIACALVAVAKLSVLNSQLSTCLGSTAKLLIFPVIYKPFRHYFRGAEKFSFFLIFAHRLHRFTPIL